MVLTIDLGFKVFFFFLRSNVIFAKAQSQSELVFFLIYIIMLHQVDDQMNLAAPFELAIFGSDFEKVYCISVYEKFLR